MNRAHDRFDAQESEVSNLDFWIALIVILLLILGFFS